MARSTTFLSTLWSGHAARFLRYSGVSAFNVIFGYLLLGLFYKVFGMAGWSANVLSVLLGSIPAFFLNKRFVWGQGGSTRYRAELLPFLVMNGLGLALSTATVHTADRLWGNPYAVVAASLAAWGSLWVLKYVLLDRVLFKQPAEPAVVARASESVPG